MSTCLSKVLGMVLRSTTPACDEGMYRRPLTRTKVREVPRPRKSTVAVPLPGLFELGPNAGTV